MQFSIVFVTVEAVIQLWRAADVKRARKVGGLLALIKEYYSLEEVFDFIDSDIIELLMDLNGGLRFYSL